MRQRLHKLHVHLHHNTYDVPSMMYHKYSDVHIRVFIEYESFVYFFLVAAFMLTPFYLKLDYLKLSTEHVVFDNK